MGSIKLISEDEATGKVKEIFEEIKEGLGIDFVPNLYRAMAPIPEYLESQWTFFSVSLTLCSGVAIGDFMGCASFPGFLPSFQKGYTPYLFSAI